jgi:hypothetical protein
MRSEDAVDPICLAVTLPSAVMGGECGGPHAVISRAQAADKTMALEVPMRGLRARVELCGQPFECCVITVVRRVA